MTAINYDTYDFGPPLELTGSTADLDTQHWVTVDDRYAGLNRAQRRAAVAKETRAWRKQQKKARRNER